MSILIDLSKKFQGKPTDKVSETERLKRVAVCDGCDLLELGIFCGDCGCLVSDKAKYKYEDCPKEFWPHEKR